MRWVKNQNQTDIMAGNSQNLIIAYRKTLVHVTGRER